MKKITTVLFLSMLIAVILGAHVTAVSADTVTYIDRYDKTMTSYGVAAPSLASAVEYATPFDPSLGTLEGIDLTFAGDGYFDILYGLNLYFLGSTATPSPYYIIPRLTIDVQGIDGFYVFASPMDIIRSYYVTGGETGSARIGFNWTFSYTYTTFLHRFIGTGEVGNVIPPFDLGGRLEDFIGDPSGPNQVSIDYVLSFREEDRFPDMPPTSVTVTSNMRVTTTYDYTPFTTVPEPSTMLLLGSGLVGLGFVRRLIRRV